MLRTSSGERKTIVSSQEERFRNIGKKRRQVYQVAKQSRYPDYRRKQVVVCYVPFANSPKLTIGMDVLVYPISVDRQLYGHMLAKIINVDTYAATKANMSYVLGTDNMLADSFSANGAVVAVTCELRADAETKSGYYWSSKKGGLMSVTTGSQISAKIITERNAPITKLFVRLKDVWGLIFGNYVKCR